MLPRKRIVSVLVVSLVLGALWSVNGLAQGYRRGRVFVRSAFIVGPAYYDPVFYPYRFYPFHPFYPFYPWGPFQWYPPYGFPPLGPYVVASAVRFHVTPRQAEVYVDGYFAGTVDDFDGVFQRLRVPPGQHEIALYLQGHKTIRHSLMLTPGRTHHLRHTMEPLAAGEANEPRPGPTTTPAPQGAPPVPPGVRPEGALRAGTLMIRVQPADADVLIDGELWRGPRGDRLVVQLPAGRHTVEVRREGFERFSTDVNVTAGETTPLNISLLQRERS